MAKPTEPSPLADLREQVERRELELKLANLRRLKRTSGKVARAASRAAGRYMALGNYANATRTRVRPGARARGGSANAHLDQSTREALRKDCQDLERNNPTGRAIIKRIADMIVGDGPIVTSTSADEAWNNDVDARFNQWMDGTAPWRVGHPDVRGRHTVPQMLRMIARAWMTDGDVLLVKTSRGQLQIIESERIRNPQGRMNTGTLIDGVEMDSFGCPVTYHVASWDIAGTNTTWTTTQVDAADAIFLPNPLDDKIGLVRGEPGMQAAVDRIEQLDNYLEKTGLAAEMATLFGLWIESDKPAEMQSIFEAGTPDQPTTETGDSPREAELQAAMVHFGAPGEKASQIKPEFPTTNFAEYVTAQLMMICADAGLPVSVTHFDVSGMSWSNQRSQLAITFRGLYLPQAVSANAVRELRRWKVEQWIAEGEVPARDDFDACEVVFAGAPVLDLKNEIEAHAMAIERGLESHDQGTQALGTGRGLDVMNKRSAEIKTAARLGIPGVVTPGSLATPTSTPATAPAPTSGKDQAGNQPKDRSVDGSAKTPEAGPVAQKSEASSAGSSGTYLVGDKTLAADLTKAVASKTIPGASATAILTSMVGLSSDEASAMISPAEAHERPQESTAAANDQGAKV